MKLQKLKWGTVDGAPVWLYEFENDGLRLRVSNYGGILQSLILKDAPGGPVDVVLGYDTLGEYRRGETFFGAMIGPIADRLANGRCVLDDRTVQLALNAGPDSMHSSNFGFDHMVFDSAPLEDGIRLTREIDEAPGGFPGRMSAELCYRLSGPRTLRLTYAARCTRETAVSFTNHSYFSLSGGTRDCRDNTLTVHADRYAETVRDADPICTGRALPVDGTPMDLRNGATVKSVVDRTDFREIASAGGIDHYFPVDGEGLREHAVLCDPDAGIALRCRSDAPGLLVYTGNGLNGEPGKGGARYGRNGGVCLETGRFPNAVNFPHLRAQALLEPGDVYRSTTAFEFCLL